MGCRKGHISLSSLKESRQIYTGANAANEERTPMMSLRRDLNGVYFGSDQAQGEQGESSGVESAVLGVLLML